MADCEGVAERIAAMTFQDVVAAVERFGADGGDVAIYRAWIAGNRGSEAEFAAWFNLGVALGRAGDRAGAVDAYRMSLAAKPGFHSAAINLGHALEALGRTAEALDTWEQALQPDSERAALLNQRARLLEQLGRLDEAEQVLRTSLLTQPEQPDAIQHWVHIRQRTCMWPALAELPGLPADRLLRMAGPLGVLALTDDVAVQREVAAGWIARKVPPAPGRLCPEAGYRHDRIRIGYVSSDFCRHAMSYLIVELFERHDRALFEVFGYCSSPDDGSEVRQRVLQSFDHVRMIRDLDDAEAAQVIRRDEIDVLIDLNGLTAGTRLPVLRWRPAPVQATYLGFIGPVPVPELDYLLCDDYVVPPGAAAAYAPTPLPIAPVYQANDGKRGQGRRPSRAEAGLPEEGFVFCCFSNHYKLGPALFAAWMRILRGVPGSVLWLATDNVWSQRNLMQAAVAEGVAAERLVFAARCDPDLYMGRLGVADLFLDTFPYNAGTVASDAMRMGLPLISVSGDSFASRMAGSLLHAIGAGRCVASSLEEYVALAMRLATDADAYRAHKAFFTRAAWDRALGDAGAFARSFEARLLTVLPGRPLPPPSWLRLDLGG